ncbi:MAG: hypothetical protein AAGF67_18365, partial [Verrucomicrobiota bacterium]
DLVLDMFRVCTTTFNPVQNPREIERIQKMLEDELCTDRCTVDFSALIEKQEAPSITQAEPPNFDIPQRVYLNNEPEERFTVLEIQAQDRIGLLYDIFTILGKLGAQVLNARISTQAGAAIDRFALVDSSSEQSITEPERLELIRSKISECLDQKPNVETLG